MEAAAVRIWHPYLPLEHTADYKQEGTAAAAATSRAVATAAGAAATEVAAVDTSRVSLLHPLTETLG